MQPWQVSYSDHFGGADRAGYRIHCALRGIGVDSQMAVMESSRQDPSIRVLPGNPPGIRGMLRRNLADWALWTQKSSSGVHRSTNLVRTGNADWLNTQRPSLVHLHWIGKDVLSLREIAELRSPLVWTLHDSWPFSGAEHHPATLSDRRFQRGYSRATRPSGDSRFDLDGFIWHRKRALWDRPFTLVAPSRWMAQNASASLLMGRWPVEVIPNPLPGSAFSSGDQVAARRNWDLEADRPTVLFGAANANDPNKGWDLLLPALQELSKAIPNAQAVVFGETTKPHNVPVNLAVRTVGQVEDELRLAELYQAADVMVVPSRMESFSQTAAEAQACGTPVVAFAATGLLDVVADGVTGYLAQPYEVADLAAGMRELLTDPDRRRSMGRAAAERARQLWAPDVVAAAYAHTYQQVLESAAHYRTS